MQYYYEEILKTVTNTFFRTKLMFCFCPLFTAFSCAEIASGTISGISHSLLDWSAIYQPNEPIPNRSHDFCASRQKAAMDNQLNTRFRVLVFKLLISHSAGGKRVKNKVI